MSKEIFKGRPPNIPYANRTKVGTWSPRWDWHYPFGEDEIHIELVNPYKRLYLVILKTRESKVFSWYARLPKINRETARKQLMAKKPLLLLMVFDPV